MAKKNLPLLRRLRTRFLRMSPERFDMTNVSQKTECGAAHCIAGHTLDLAGYKVKFNSDGNWEWFTPSGMPIKSPLRSAARLLGMNYDDEAYYLFHEFELRTPKQAAKRIEGIIAEAEA